MSAVSQSLCAERVYAFNIRKGNKVFRHCVNRVAGHVISIGQQRGHWTTYVACQFCLRAADDILRVSAALRFRELVLSLSFISLLSVISQRKCPAASHKRLSIFFAGNRPSLRPPVCCFLITPPGIALDLLRNCFWKCGLHWILISLKTLAVHPGMRPRQR